MTVLGACGAGPDETRVDIAIIGSPDAVRETGLRLSSTGQHLRAATAEGLVTLDAAGAVVPAIAERWIVTEDGQSYIFRLRDAQWPDGRDITSRAVRARFLTMMTQLDGTSLGRDLSIVDDVVARAGRVVEFQLKSPMPDFLQLLAQPELGLRDRRAGIGPMALDERPGGLLLTALAPATRGLPQEDDWADDYRPVTVRIEDAPTALAMFDQGAVDLVLNGHIAHLPMADTGPLSRGTVRLDGAFGLFGFALRDNGGNGGDGGGAPLTATPALREALSMAVDRDAAIAPFNLGGWVPTTRMVNPGLPGDTGAVGERWADLSLTQRQDIARARIARWTAETGRAATIRVAMPTGPGTTTVFERLRGDWAAIGVTAQMVDIADREQAVELIWIDRVARFGHARWFLNQFTCTARIAICSAEADDIVSRALTTVATPEREALWAQAEIALTRENVFIPLGAPIRWSLVRGDITGFVENPWAIHPLFPLSRRPE